MPWPSTFSPRRRLFQAVATVCTFLASRQHIPPVYATVKSSIEAAVGRPVADRELAELAALAPKLVRFKYVPEYELQVHETGASGADVFAPSSERPAEVLVLDFVDQTLKRERAPRGRGPAGMRDVRMPTFALSAISDLVAKRVAKFAAAVDKFLAACAAAGTEPETALAAATVVPEPANAAVDALDQQLAAQTGVPLAARRPMTDIIAGLQAPPYAGQIVTGGRRTAPARDAVYGTLDFALSQELADALYTASDVTRLYAHQAAALNALEAGRDVIVSTSTSSGKSLIYQVPTLRALETDPDARALFVFPTKALAQDQLRALRALLALVPGLADVVVDTYDGDTPADDRHRIRQTASVIFTNPDMLHVNVLPAQEHWQPFLRNLRLVVIDELHVYAGLFGAHVALVLRRLRRLCASVGNTAVRFVSCSATIANPVAHMAAMFGIDEPVLVDADGSPAGAKHMLVWNAPLRDANDPAAGRVDIIDEAAAVVATLVLEGVRTIVFCRVRTMCELQVRAIRAELERRGRGDVAAWIMSYRGGYTPQDRRRIEREMFDGRLLAIVATSALELGIDIGALDAVVIVGFPMSLANLRQQSGRAGRRNKDSLTVVVGGSHPLDQHYMAHPEELFDRPTGELAVDVASPLVLEAHLQCAAFELPVDVDADRAYFGDIGGLVDRLAAVDPPAPDGRRLYTCHPRFLPWPARHSSIRAIEEDKYAVVDVTGGRNVVLEEIEASRTTFSLYEGAIFIHQGRSYIVRDFDPDQQLARVERTAVEWTTSQRDYTDVDAVEIEALRPAAGGTGALVYYGKVRVTMVVFGYFKLDARKRIIDAVEVTTTPKVEINTRGLWTDVPRAALEAVRRKQLHLAGGLHAAAHAVLGLTGTVAGNMADDLRTECKAPEKELSARESARKRPARLTFYDANGGRSSASRRSVELARSAEAGSGMSRKVFEFADTVFAAALARVEACACATGCPECVVAPGCAERNVVLSKPAATLILRAVLGRPLREAEVADGPEPHLAHAPAVETVVPAVRVRAAADVEVLAEVVHGRPVFTFKPEADADEAWR
ncbi:uncharacterized protein V1510DRAFT_437237 [Dipodascopsis tothii]|uniref:uncharacterized protein n=1 Tax=Dipodascopsis tothii TaxID=44089 RepID=UPI0034CE82A6